MSCGRLPLADQAQCSGGLLLHYQAPSTLSTEIAQYCHSKRPSLHRLYLLRTNKVTASNGALIFRLQAHIPKGVTHCMHMMSHMCIQQCYANNRITW